MTTKTLLVSWVYAGALGHAVEAFKQANSFKNGNPDFEVSVMINSAVGIDLGNCIGSIENVYAVNLREFEPGTQCQIALDQFPRQWDYLFTDNRAGFPCGFDDRIDRFHQEFRDWVQAEKRTGGGENTEGFPEMKPSALVAHLPIEARAYAAQFWHGAGYPRIAILPSSGSHQKAPPPEFWTEVIGGLIENYPNASFALIGLTGRTLNFATSDAETFTAQFPDLRNGFDQNLLRQLAIIEESQLYVSPHSGMSFAAQCVGTPWLVISGTVVHEYVLNGVPFRCIYPDCDVYPCVYPLGDRMLAPCKELLSKAQLPICMQHHTLNLKIPDLLSAAEDLIEDRYSYIECVRSHVRELNARGIEGIPLMDGEAAIDVDYVFPPRS